MQTQDAEGFSALALGQGQERPGDDKLLVKFFRLANADQRAIDGAYNANMCAAHYSLGNR